ncbi:hypothetical protein [Escherichia coli]|uniref:hypothetical protein n=1 Tax=Escherichia coli TaxID=562 RepID=UPI0021D0A1E0|nr:hypothetical protein [Escherichia coli]MCU6292804.1 hypothetical protein [Escherichia coli]
MNIRAVRIFSFVDMNEKHSYVFENVNKLNPHTAKMIETMKILSLHIEVYYLQDDSVFVYDDGWYDGVFYDDISSTADYYFLVSNPLFSTKTLFDITDTSVYDTSHVELLKFDPVLFNKETAYWMTDFFSNIPVK